nr:hypothetical protein [Caldilineaceae bacterium]MBP8109935.1 hypothetical protein [Caldilineaceae bacterium]MBP8123995.1 hypothetical protein [Caldilineaceae bacterium]MBP9074010.1 hypothetical protein [Caldilineaceae bacterium]
VCQILWSRLVSRRTVAGAAAQISDIKERQADVLATIRAMPEPPPALVTSSMQRLTDLIEQAEPILQTIVPAEPVGLPPSRQPVTANGGSLGSTQF